MAPRGSLLGIAPAIGSCFPRSAQPCFAGHAADFFPYQPLDDARKMFVEPGLQQRPEEIAYDILQGPIGALAREITLPLSATRQRAELGKSGSCRPRSRSRKDALAAGIESWRGPGLAWCGSARHRRIRCGR